MSCHGFELYKTALTLYSLMGLFKFSLTCPDLGTGYLRSSPKPRTNHVTKVVIWSYTPGLGYPTKKKEGLVRYLHDLSPLYFSVSVSVSCPPGVCQGVHTFVSVGTCTRVHIHVHVEARSNVK